MNDLETIRDGMLQKLLVGRLNANDDQTVYIGADEQPTASTVQAALTTPSPKNPPPFTTFLWDNYNKTSREKPKSIDFSMTAGSASDPDAEGSTKEVRVQASSCYRAKGWSLSLRGADAFRKPPSTATPRRVTAPTPTSVATWMDKALPFLGYAPSDKHVYDSIKTVSLASYAEVGQSILDLLLEQSSEHLKGLLLITGETKCGKSNIARGMIYSYLQGLGNPQRNPHLLTYEDPIERWFYTFDDVKGNKPLFKGRRRRIDYTPREKGIDCEKLRECTMDALRQTPAVLFAGELRDEEDLAEAVHFGGTGHFIVATSHAGSLVESVEKILSAMKVTHPVQLAAIAPKILGIAHLKSVRATYCAEGHTLVSPTVVPAVYRRCSAGLQALVADGLASILPSCPIDEQDLAQFGSLGRQYMARKMLAPNPNRSHSIVVDPSNTAWNEAILVKNSMQRAWKTHWRKLRGFHSGVSDASTDKSQRNSKPLWMQCAEDDLNAVG